MNVASEAEGIVSCPEGGGKEGRFPGVGGETSRNPQCSLAAGKCRDFSGVFCDLCLMLSLRGPRRLRPGFRACVSNVLASCSGF